VAGKFVVQAVSTACLSSSSTAAKELAQKELALDGGALWRSHPVAAAWQRRHTCAQVNSLALWLPLRTSLASARSNRVHMRLHRARQLCVSRNGIVMKEEGVGLLARSLSCDSWVSAHAAPEGTGVDDISSNPLPMEDNIKPATFSLRTLCKPEDSV
jgi:hypothetical protein